MLRMQSPWPVPTFIFFAAHTPSLTRCAVYLLSASPSLLDPFRRLSSLRHTLQKPGRGFVRRRTQMTLFSHYYS